MIKDTMTKKILLFVTLSFFLIASLAFVNTKKSVDTKKADCGVTQMVKSDTVDIDQMVHRLM